MTNQAVMILVSTEQARMKASTKSRHRAEGIPMNEAIAWESVLQRDASADERFFYGVTTTGIYCRPSCPSPNPKRDNVAVLSYIEADELTRGETVSRASFGAGYGSSSRVYEDAPTRLGMTPATYKSGGSGAHIDYIIAKTSLGSLLVGATNRGVCAVTLGDNAEVLE